MGRLDLIIPDDIERELRIELINRFGGKKGDLSRAVAEAIEMWINSPPLQESTIEDLKKTAMNLELLPSEREKATKMLSGLGKAALPALNEISKNQGLLPSQREMALDEIDRILKGV